MMDRSVILEVKYEPDATDAQRSLIWFAPELVDAPLTLHEEDDVCEWTGVIDNDTYTRFADSWGLDDQLERHRRVFDGMEIEHGGVSPIIWISLTVGRTDRCRA